MNFFDGRLGRSRITYAKSNFYKPVHDFKNECESTTNLTTLHQAFKRKFIKFDNRTPLHEEILFNQKGRLNDGPSCRCSINARKSGIRHGIFPGEECLDLCDPHSNNADRLYHYNIVIEPKINFESSHPTSILHDGYEYIFEGFSLLSHSPLYNITNCKISRYNIDYNMDLIEEEMPPNFTVNCLELFKNYLYNQLLELYDLDWHGPDNRTGCPRFHLYPRFSRLIRETGERELLPIAIILQYLLAETKPLVSIANKLGREWLNHRPCYKDSIVWAPKAQPSALRIDQIDFENGKPVIIHFGLKPSQLTYSSNPQYQRALRELSKIKNLIANKPKETYADKQIIAEKEKKLQQFRSQSLELKRDTIILECNDLFTTGLSCDIIQHAMLIPVIVYQIRFRSSLEKLEGLLDYTFEDKSLLQLALTHPSYRENYGTNPDHARNSLNNLSIRQPSYGINKTNIQTRKRGINTLINIMSKFGCEEETASNIQHNERLEFLGDSVVEFLTSIHLFFMFPDLEEGGLATYRAALVQNQHLATLAKKLKLDNFMLYTHGSDLCHDLELRHAMANCFEALMAALFLDSGLEIADKVLSNVLFDEDPQLLSKWVNYPKHPLQLQNPDGDRHLIETIPLLQKLTEFEQITGIEFKNIRLLARAFTHRSIGFNNLTLGTNQRMEFLGDTVLQLIASDYLYKHFPVHHEGHLSLLRSSLVNNRTQMVVCDDLGMVDYLQHRTKGSLRGKDRADLLEAFIGALYVDNGIDRCRAFCSVCFFPRLEDFIIHQSWNDPKSKLQQCCLTLRSVDSREPDIPIYKVIETIGPTNTRVYNVAVYFKDRRLAIGEGPSIQDAEMSAATNALNQYREHFPDLSLRKNPVVPPLKKTRYLRG